MADRSEQGAFAPADRHDYGAFYTPPATADLMVELADIGPVGRVLEPSAGDGAFIAALLRAGVEPGRITAWELDPHACELLRDRFPGVRVEQRDTLLSADPEIDGRFEWIIANPPYLNKQSAYVRAHRSELTRRFGTGCGASETFAMFLWLGLDLLSEHGALVYLVADSLRTLPSHARLRERILTRHGLDAIVSPPPRLFEDASVRTVIVRVGARPARGPVRVLAESSSEADYRGEGWSSLPREDLGLIEGHPLLLTSPPSIMALFGDGPRLGEWARGHIGMHTRDNARHLAALEGSPLARRFERRRMEPGTFRVIGADEAAGEGWRPYLKEGGEKDFWSPPAEFVDWSPEARAGYVSPRGGLFGQPGIAVSGIARRLSVRLMPAGCRWDTNKVHGLIPADAETGDYLLGLLNSDLYSYLAKGILNTSPSLQLSDLWRLPVPPPDPDIAAAARLCVAAVREGADSGPPRRMLNALVCERLRISEDDLRVVRRFLSGRGLPAYC